MAQANTKTRLVVIQDDRIGIYECNKGPHVHLLASFVDDDYSTCTDAEEIEKLRVANYDAESWDE